MNPSKKTDTEQDGRNYTPPESGQKFSATSKYPLLVNFSGPDECGKSFFVQQMFKAILPEGYHEELKDSGQVLSNQE
ncbi:MAG TPA: hypothetical protein VN673_10645, partial [Clostridia bacterium]|nr:hypothetical protein [Clostridia bacterium]